MGADGGSIPDRRDLVRTKGKAEITDRALLRELFFLCALSKRALSRPVVLDPLGKLYNKDALIEFFLDRSKYGDGDKICGYLKGVKDLLTLNLTPNPDFSPSSSSTTSNIPSRAPFVCPLSLREMSGTVPFIALRPCGCVFSDASIRAVVPHLTKGVGAKAISREREEKEEKPDEAKPVVTTDVSSPSKLVACPNCGASFDPTLPESILPINPTRAVQEVMLEALLTARAAAKSSKKRKAMAVETVTAVTDDHSMPPAKMPKSKDEAQPRSASHSASPAPTGQGRSSGTPPVSGTVKNNLHRSVHQKLAEQEKKRMEAQAGMSDAVKSMFAPKDTEKTKMGGAHDFFGRTFTRYA